MQYRTYKALDLAAINSEVRTLWETEQTFRESLNLRKGSEPYVFYEGPPSANGKPGIHHVMSRAIKDLFCRYKTMKGFLVERKSGWDTHGLPVELQVEKKLGITKDDIGSRVSIEEYNRECRKDVMAYTDEWEELTREMGYWVDLNNPYVTYETDYIESVWSLLKKLYEKDLIYRGHSIQPYSPAAGTGLSSHELNMPGAYRSVKDTTVIAQFRIVQDDLSEPLLKSAASELFFLAWTTTPWTLPSNTALGTGAKIDYALVDTFNQYTGEPISVVLANELVGKYFTLEGETLEMAFSLGDKIIPWRRKKTIKGAALSGIRYEQLFKNGTVEDGDAFKVLNADFVSTEDGTGIVHLAPSFGADDYRAAKKNGIGSLTLVDKTGRFTSEMGEFAGQPVKLEYFTKEELDSEMMNQGVNDPNKLKTTDVKLSIKLKEENRAFRVEKYEHNYPHCWRTDKPILYYPLDAWFIRTTASKERMIELNKTINWKPAHTGSKRFGDWLENLIDWNLSRSRYWGTPLPIWTDESHSEYKCIGSIAELRKEVEASVKAGHMDSLLPNDLDLHRPYVDDIVLVGSKGQALKREKDLIDVWFDSGAMPYAQLHYPFEGEKELGSKFPADFIAEGVDQTRGWFFTLHAIATMLFDSVAYKNVVSNGLVLDKSGQKMSKRLGNTINPFETIADHGADATRWYMLANANPWDNLRFDLRLLR